MILTQKASKPWVDYIMIVIGAIITAFSINIFLVPYKIAPGGLSGIATVLYYITNGKFPIGTTMLVLNIPLFILGIRFIGKKFVLKTFFGTIMLSAVIDVTEPFTSQLTQKFGGMSEGMSYSQDLLLYSLFGGVLMGLGLGLVFRYGATTGGTDLAARIVNHVFPVFTIGEVLLIIDTSVIIIATIVFKSFQLGMYAIVTLFISSKVIDAILEGVNFAKAVFIISDHSENISERILKDLDRGVTALEGTGMYTGSNKKVLLCVLNRGQIPVLKNIVKSIDHKAFIILADVREVLGEGFKNYD
jgi:uncharacterized membrane-anchored protein YitT (DUF2179 family)